MIRGDALGPQLCITQGRSTVAELLTAPTRFLFSFLLVLFRNELLRSARPSYGNTVTSEQLGDLIIDLTSEQLGDLIIDLTSEQLGDLIIDLTSEQQCASGRVRTHAVRRSNHLGVSSKIG
eukprot:1196293-Prorocentrum_minimum.AAC.2